MNNDKMIFYTASHNTGAPVNNTHLRVYKVWDLPTRLFHWINFTAVISLIFFGLIMLYKKELGITSVEAKIGLKEVHVIIGYIFVLNLAFRILWAFLGNAYARWCAILPGKGFLQAVHAYRASLARGEPQQFLGHNPLGRLAVTVMLTLLVIMACTGLIRAGTDIYFPPFGAFVADYVAAADTDPGSLIPYNPAGVDAEKLDRLKAFKGPFGDVHIYTAFILMFVIVVHIAAVIFTEVRKGGGIISAMFTGKKVLSSKPVDGEGTDAESDT
jgi:cytochrome b